MTILSHATPFTFDAAFEEYVESVSGDRERDARYHPSGLYFCDRRQIYDVRMTPREATSGSKRPLLIGKVLHEQMQAALEAQVGKTIRTLYIEGRVDDADSNVLGNFDALYELMDGTWELFEAKSANSYSFRMVSKSGEAKPEHANQALTYLEHVRTVGFWFASPHVLTGDPIAVHHPPIPELERVRVVYLDKDRHAVREVVYTHSDQWREGYVAHLGRLDAYRADGEALPPRLPRDSWQCQSEDGAGRWCPYWDRCWNVDGEGVELT